MASLVARKQKKRRLFRAVHDLTLPRESSKAIELINEYLRETNLTDVDVLLLKGHVLDSSHEFDQGLRVYQQVLRIDRDNAPALNDLGGYYSNIKRDYRKALRYYTRALRLIESGRFHLDEQDEFIEACVGKADALRELNRPMDALKCIVHGLQKYPADIVLGGALERAQEWYRALQERKFGKRYHKVKRQLERLRRAKPSGLK